MSYKMVLYFILDSFLIFSSIRTNWSGVLVIIGYQMGRHYYLSIVTELFNSSFFSTITSHFDQFFGTIFQFQFFVNNHSNRHSVHSSSQRFIRISILFLSSFYSEGEGAEDGNNTQPVFLAKTTTLKP